MAQFRKNADLEEYRDITDDVQESDFVPYACHFTPETLITKNGELLQTIKITGFSYEMLDSSGMDLRTAIRRAILDNLDSNDYAVWLHTIRRRTNLDPGGTYKEAFAYHLHETWNKRNGWNDKFTNELYITIVRQGESTDITNVKKFLGGLFAKRQRQEREAYIEQCYPALSRVVEKMLLTLSDFGAQRLSVVEEQGIFYSQLCRFLGKIINLADMPMPLPDIDLAQYLTTQEITFGFNAMEVRSHEGRRKFGSILTLKEYQELSSEALDRFLQMPAEFIVTQCISFINNKKALEEYKYQHDLMNLSGDKDLAIMSGLEDIMGSNRGSAVDYGEQQLSVFLLADDLRALERYIVRANATLHSLGMIAVREDIRFEECYWAQLPGNFVFLKRMKSINTRRFGGFASLNNYPAGKLHNNLWGEAVSLLYTAAKTPYFFNFHIEDNGHTLMTGPHGSGKTILLHFLLTEARKYNPRLFLFDRGRSAELLMQSMQGEYIIFLPRAVDKSSNPFKLQPLFLRDTPINRRFLHVWLGSLVGLNEEIWSEKEAALLEQAVAHIYTLPDHARRMGAIAEFIRTHDTEMADQLAAWHGEGKYAHLFDHGEETFQTQTSMIAFDMDALVEDATALLPVVSYLLHRITTSLDYIPCMIVLKEALSLLDNPLYAGRIESWFEKLRSKNTMVICTISDVEEAAASAITPSLITSSVTQIYLPDSDAGSAYESLFRLNETETAYLGLMQEEERHFLLKRGDETIVAELNLTGMEEIITVLSGRQDLLQEFLASLPPTQEKPVWMPSPTSKEAA